VVGRARLRDPIRVDVASPVCAFAEGPGAEKGAQRVAGQAARTGQEKARGEQLVDAAEDLGKEAAGDAKGQAVSYFVSLAGEFFGSAAKSLMS
jgi:hypothetical protein